MIGAEKTNFREQTQIVPFLDYIGKQSILERGSSAKTRSKGFLVTCIVIDSFKWNIFISVSTCRIL